MAAQDVREPFVIVERPGERAPEIPEGCRPGILLVDAGAEPGRGLSPALFDAGFDVYRTARRESASDLIQGRSSIVMALVRLDQPSLPSGEVIRDLAGLRPGLWIGMLGDWPDRVRAEEGYRSGADDLIPTSASLKATAARLAMSVPGALRKREQAARRVERKRRFPRLAHVWREVTTTIVGGLALGILLAVLLQAWQDSRTSADPRLDRLMGLLESTGSRGDVEDRRFDRGVRSEALDLQRRMHEEAASYHRQQLDETRFDRLFRTFVPQYPRP